MKQLPTFGERVFFITAGHSANHLPETRRSFYGVSIPAISTYGLSLFKGNVGMVDVINHLVYVLVKDIVHTVPQERLFYTKEEAIEDVEKTYKAFNEMATKELECLKEGK